MADTKLDLEIARLVAAPREKVWRAWSDPGILKQWWCPKPWVTEARAFDFRNGGAFHTFMSGPEGGESDNPGLFLEVVPMERIVWTSMLVAVSTRMMRIAGNTKTWASSTDGGP
jgi:uncharacterized protein YndB with AHSA1/START domain